MTTPNTPPQMHFCLDTIGSYDGLFNGEHVLASAGVAYRNPGADTFSLHVPDNPVSLMVDSGGFQAATRWNGPQIPTAATESRFPYSPADLHQWAERIGADRVAGMDVACEDAQTLYEANPDHRHPYGHRTRMLASLENQRRQRNHYEDADYDHQFMPVIQGKHPEDYEEFIHQMQMERLDQYDWLALGTVCKRDSLDDIYDIVTLVRDYYPDKNLHLFGATLNVWRDPRFADLFDSSDTAAWNWGATSKAHKKELYHEYKAKVDTYASALASQEKLSPSSSAEP